MEFHPIANIFPLLSGDELQELADDIRDNGLKEPIWTYESKILDGRNRSAACVIAGVDPEYRKFKGGPEEAFRHVWSLNFHRRHMTQSQKGACAADAGEVLEACREKAKQRQGERTDRETDTSRKDFLEVKQSRDEVGNLFGVSGRYVDDAVAVKKKDPELHEKVKSGELTLPQAKTKIREDERSKTLKVMEWPKGTYRVIYADPPWAYNDKRTGTLDSGGVGAQYDTMTVQQICELPVKGLSYKDSVLFLWVTSPLLEDAFAVIGAWGFKYKSSFVWCKGRSFNGHYNAVSHEFLLIATRGSCTPDTKSLFDSVMSVTREGHSKKPEAVREIIDVMYLHGPRIELFARSVDAKGWDVWGDEA